MLILFPFKVVVVVVGMLVVVDVMFAKFDDDYSCLGVDARSPLDCTLLIEKPVLEKSVTLALSNGFYLKFPINSDGFGKVAFFLELGLKFISGKNDSPVFYNLSLLYIFYIFYNFSDVCRFWLPVN